LLCVSACNGSQGSSIAPIVKPTATPTPTPTPGTQQVTTSKIAHVIVVTMENRTPDNLFGNMALIKALPVDIHTNAIPGVGVTPSIGLESPIDPGHSYPELIAEWDNGRLDGFASDGLTPFGSAEVTPVTPTTTIDGASVYGFPYGSVPESEVEIYETLAAVYGFSDSFYSSRLVPSFPGHQFMVAGQSGASDDPDTAIWGCDAPSNSLVSSFSANGTEAPGPSAFPCYDYAALADQLDAANITWKYYTGAPGTIDGNIDAYGAIHHIRYGPDFTNHVSMPYSNLDIDLADCSLPSVSYINAPAFASDHSGTLTAGGPGFVGDLYLNLIETTTAKSPSCQYYNNTLMIVTWDDAGGWADHDVPPKDAVGNSFGFRVPFIAISPYVKTGFNVPGVGNAYDLSQARTGHFYDFGSIIQYIQENFGLPVGGLNTRDLDSKTRGADLATDLLDYSRATPIAPIGGLVLSSFRREVATAKSKTHQTWNNEPVDDDK
jgi:phospholipase C